MAQPLFAHTVAGIEAKIKKKNAYTFALFCVFLMNNSLYPKKEHMLKNPKVKT